MSSFLCFICHSTVSCETNEDTREKYREVVGINLCLDSHLCFICCHVLKKLTMFRSTCLKRSLEYPVLFSEEGALNLQRSDIELHVQCPDDLCQQQSHINNDMYMNSLNENVNYSDESNNYVKLEEDNEFNDDVNLDDGNEFNDNINSDEVNVAPKITEDTFKSQNGVLPQPLEYYDDSFQYNVNLEENLYNNSIIKNNNTKTIQEPNDDINVYQCTDFDINNDTDNNVNVSNFNDDVQNINIDCDKSMKVHKKRKSKKLKKESFEKIIITLEQQKAELEANRRQKKYIEAEFKCYNCAQGFLFKDTYQAHMMRHEESNGEHRCTICTLRFASVSVLRSHTALHAERYRCPRCGTLLRARARAQHRLLCLRASQQDRVACHLCGNLFKDSSGLQQHLRRVHTSKTGRLYPCGICGETFRNQASVRTHMLKHLKKKFTCDQCSATYSSPYTLNQHKKKHNNTEERHFCTTCAISYSSRKGLLAHRRNHLSHQQTVFECSKCNRVLPNQRALAAHERKVHTNEIHCEKLARKTHCSQRRPPQPAICHLCGNSFKGNSKLNRHLREVCEKSKLEEQLALLYE